MAAPSKKLYIGVLIVFALFIPLGVVIDRGGPEIAAAWRFRKIGRPLERKGKVVGYIVSSGYDNPIRELDLSGKLVRAWTARGTCFGIEVLANGNLLLGSWSKAEEIDREGKVVWEPPASAGLSCPTDVSRLANGNTLVADANGNRVVEFTPEGKEVWSHKCEYSSSAQRLRNGNTLIGCGTSDGRVIEVSPAGEVAWEKEGLGSPFHVRRLANGDTLVADYYQNKVTEFDRNGEVIWEYKCGSPVGAERLPDGRTLVSSSARREIILVSPDGKEEVLYKGSTGRACAVYEGK